MLRRVLDIFTRRGPESSEMPPANLLPTSTPLSSPDSYATATESPSHPLDVTATDISSPVAEPKAVPDEPEPYEPEPYEPEPYDKASQLPPELKQHCQIYLEENLYLIALNLFHSLLSSRRHGSNNLTYCPPPSQLASLNTAIIHPKFTTRPREEGWDEVSVESLVYLRSLLARVGPINGRFKEAFRFASSSRGPTPDWPSDDEDLDEDGDDDTHAQLRRRHQEDGVFRRGQDFFHVAGWAFNCSVLYPNRWRHWKQWLEFMLDLLEADLTERHEMDIESGDNEFPMLRDSILASYIGQRSGRTAGGAKWIMSAIFADGSKTSSSIFQEIWVKEHRGSSKNAMNKRKREAVNIEKGNYGGWLDDDSVYSSQASEPPTPQKRRTHSGHTASQDFQALEPTFVESIPLRQRLFSLLSYLCHYLPRPPLDLSDLYQRFETTTKSLPLPLFTAFVNNHPSTLRLESQISILQGVLLLLMPSSAPSPARVDPAREDGISARILERCFLPFAANTLAADDNAKVSVLLEHLAQIVWREEPAQFAAGGVKERLSAAVEKGVAARSAKVKRKKTGARGGRGSGSGGEDPDAEARIVLEMSGKRLLAMAELIAADGQDRSEQEDGEDEEEEEDEDEVPVGMEVDEDEGDIDPTFVTARDGLSSTDDDDDDDDLEVGDTIEAQLEQEQEEEEEKHYCLCRRVSSGNMVACDGAACPHEWFHWKCVGLRAEPRGKWFCPDCRDKLRGRRKR
ncbi:hypothetical protein F5B20DRAFT_560082 [Whalleya microplaca]|nr:hypothetical protein F5B20DRAFT_560082 [Whalleya microplaca]